MGPELEKDTRTEHMGSWLGEKSHEEASLNKENMEFMPYDCTWTVKAWEHDHWEVREAVEESEIPLWKAETFDTARSTKKIAFEPKLKNLRPEAHDKQSAAIHTP